MQRAADLATIARWHARFTPSIAANHALSAAARPQPIERHRALPPAVQRTIMVCSAHHPPDREVTFMRLHKSR
jgi:hypothetical protein